ncbi:MAG: hypothetical protein ACREJB_04850 [Planctomycetaceae bacterium]
MLTKLLFAAACVVLPVVWGVVVNWVFGLWRNRRGDEPIFPDYQI